MWKTIPVWILLIFLKMCGRSIDKKKVLAYNRQYNKVKRAKIESSLSSEREKPMRSVSYDARRRVSKQVVLYARDGKTVRVKTRLAGRRYTYA